MKENENQSCFVTDELWFQDLDVIGYNTMSIPETYFMLLIIDPIIKWPSRPHFEFQILLHFVHAGEAWRADKHEHKTITNT